MIHPFIVLYSNIEDVYALVSRHAGNSLFKVGELMIADQNHYSYSGPTTLIFAIAFPNATPIPMEAFCVNL